jgi:hypothetical protein
MASYFGVVNRSGLRSRGQKEGKAAATAKSAANFAGENFKNFFCEIRWWDIESKTRFGIYMLYLWILYPSNGPNR